MKPDDAHGFRTTAAAYDRHIGRYGPQLAKALLSVTGVAEGQRALDVGCGPGALTAALAQLLGASRVAAVDPSESYVDAVRQRLPGVAVEVESAESLHFDDGRFDLVLCQLVVNFMSDPAAGVSEMRRVARSGGTVASCVWDYAGEMTLLRAFWDAATELDPNGGREHDEGRVMRYCDREGLVGLWERVGLEGVTGHELVVRAGYEDFDDLWDPLEAGAGPSGAYAASLGPEERGALREALRRRLGAPDGPFTLTARAWCAVGTAR